MERHPNYECVEPPSKEEVLGILRRMNILDEDWDEKTGGASSLGFIGELTPNQVENMSAGELMARIGPEALKRFENDLKNNPEFVEKILQTWRPWWQPSPKVQEVSADEDMKQKGQQIGKIVYNQDPIPEHLEELPPLSKICRIRPTEMLWDNLVELAYLYCYFNRIFAGDIMENSGEFCKYFLALSAVLNSSTFAHTSVVHALRSAETSVVMESTLYLSEETKATLLDDMTHIFKSSSNLVALLAGLQRVFEKGISDRKANYFAAKKLYFYNVWINDELRNDGDLVETIVTSMFALITGFRSKRLEKLNS